MEKSRRRSVGDARRVAVQRLPEKSLLDPDMIALAPGVVRLQIQRP